jgi:hypothetical protein
MNTTPIDVFSCVIFETQNVVIVQNDNLDKLVKADIQIPKQIWTDMAEEEKLFTPYLTKYQKKETKKLTTSIGESYNTRSNSDTSHMSV